VQEQRQDLHRLAQPHVVRQASPQPEAPEGGQPGDPSGLVGTEPAGEAGRLGHPRGRRRVGGEQVKEALQVGAGVHHHPEPSRGAGVSGPAGRVGWQEGQAEGLGQAELARIALAVEEGEGLCHLVLAELDPSAPVAYEGLFQGGHGLQLLPRHGLVAEGDPPVVPHHRLPAEDAEPAVPGGRVVPGRARGEVQAAA
jgi:hypothetical protein